MNKNEFEKKLANIPEVEPDTFDELMISDADMQNDNTFISMGSFKTLMEYSGKISLRVPRSLHMRIAEEARKEGVSLNQYALYKLSI